MRSALLLLLSLWLFVSRKAYADLGDIGGNYVSFGPSLGAHMNRGGTALLIGGELTLVHVSSYEMKWWGAVADGRFTAGGFKSGLVSLGFEAGDGPVGFHIAPVLLFAPGGPNVGGQVGLSAGVFWHVYARVGVTPRYGPFGELALQFKLPVQLR